MPKTVADWLETKPYGPEELAERAGIPLQRIVAIVEGRWLPSPEDRRRIAAVLEVEIDQVIWGHTMDLRNLRYRQQGLPGNMRSNRDFGMAEE